MNNAYNVPHHFNDRNLLRKYSKFLIPALIAPLFLLAGVGYYFHSIWELSLRDETTRHAVKLPPVKTEPGDSRLRGAPQWTR